MPPTYWTRNNIEWSKVLRWLETELKEFYSVCMQHEQMPHYSHAPHGARDGVEMTAEEYIRTNRDLITRIRKEAESSEQKRTGMSFEHRRHVF